MQNVNTKTCKKCGKILPLEEFDIVPSMKDKHSNTCKNCVRERKGAKRTPDTLFCPVCKKELPYYEFKIARKSKTGRMWCCKKCESSNTTVSKNNFRKAHDEVFRNSISAQSRTSRQKHIIHNMWKAAKSRADKKGIEFNIEESDIIIPNICPLLEVPFKFGDKNNYDYSPSLDRIDNTKGYIKGNIQVISKKANTMKSSATLQELNTFCKNILRYSPIYTEKESIELENKESLG